MLLMSSFDSDSGSRNNDRSWLVVQGQKPPPTPPSGPEPPPPHTHPSGPEIRSLRRGLVGAIELASHSRFKSVSKAGSSNVGGDIPLSREPQTVSGWLWPHPRGAGHACLRWGGALLGRQETKIRVKPGKKQRQMNWTTDGCEASSSSTKS